ncbi:hypothetical protein K435DRAFT_801175 [Dendrothele bispora CBS 962.96]|uniref:Uncharacterized protein n=1 Tax=Dendrothele bispora (strain CBS 962.96) TaxID=1314807 RepID=A0A4S8LQ45_DENBC|nr:hypothetical protein K435DRAFT_801175 [Dendrothele bispora CBS 962.96]
MPSSIPSTVVDDDDDICPVCDGECTCHKQPSTPYHPPPISSTSPHHRPILKIKLPAHTTQPASSSSSSALIHDPAPVPAPPVPKRRGRPPKNPHAVSTASTSTYQRPKPSVPRRPPPPKKKQTTRKKPSKRKQVQSTDSSDLTDVDETDDLNTPAQFPTFLPASAIPSIVSNSSASEDSDDGDLSASSGFLTDSSIEAEEENFIVTEEERARVRRELFGDDSLFKRRDNRNDNWVIRPRKTSVGAPSDVDMDIDDEDATEDDDEDDDDDDQDEDEEDEDGADSSVAAAAAAGPSRIYSGLATSWSDEDDDEESSFDADLFFANLSDSERTRTDSDGDDESGSTTQSNDDPAQDGDHSDLEGIAASIIPHLRQQGFINLPFEVAEGWDGQVVFTNGINESGGFTYLDASDFDVIAPPDMSAEPSTDDGDVDMFSTDADEEGYEQDVDLDTAEGEGDGDTTDEDLVGDDDLPNERAMRLFNTPFSFSTLSSINPLSTMSPVATARRRNNSVDSSLDSPRPADILAGRVSSNVIWEDEADAHDHSDELVNTEDSFDKERRERDRIKRGGMPRSGVFQPEPSETGSSARQAIIDDSHKDVPSPHPRFRGRIGHGVLGRHKPNMSQSSVSSGFDSLLQRSFDSTPLRPSSLPPPSTKFSISSDLPVSSYNSDIPLAAATITSPEPGNVSPPTQPIDLSDVLDPSFLAPESNNHTESSVPPPDTPTTSLSSAGYMSSTDNEDQVNQRHIRNLDRWDLISVGAFRKTREAIVIGSPGHGHGYVSDVPGTPGGWSDSAVVNGDMDFGYGYGRYKNVLRASPLTTMLWHNKNGQKLQQMQRSVEGGDDGGGGFSPELLPIGGGSGSRDGDRTPTSASHPSGSGTGSGLQPAFSVKPSSKSKKEMKKERKLKRRNGAGTHNLNRHTSQQQQRHQHHHTTKMRQHHSHGHYGNTKSRSMGSVQRTNFFSSPVPMLSL